MSVSAGLRCWPPPKTTSRAGARHVLSHNRDGDNEILDHMRDEGFASEQEHLSTLSHARTTMSNASTADLNSKGGAANADVEKQLTHDTATVPIAAPKTLGAGVSVTSGRVKVLLMFADGATNRRLCDDTYYLVAQPHGMARRYHG
jgi:hypothetical protein